MEPTTTPTRKEANMADWQTLAAQAAEATSALRLAHLEADHRLAAGDTSDLLPGIVPARAVATAERIIRSDYHDGCERCGR